jgi:RimJ/RimL family protein N-acetyltransferase
MILKNGEELLIRKANPEDAEDIIEYLNIVGGESDNLLFGKNEFTLTVEQEREHIKAVNCSEKGCMLIGRINGVIASVVSLSGYGRERIAHRGEIAVSVREDFWNSGVGTAMINELIYFAKKTANIEVIGLNVKSDNVNAIHLYERLGFKKIGTFEKFFKINGKYYNSDMMNLYL